MAPVPLEDVPVVTALGLYGAGWVVTWAVMLGHSLETGEHPWRQALRATYWPLHLWRFLR